MIYLHRVVSIARWLIHRTKAERELNDELQAYVDLSVAEKLRDGVLPSDARRLALLELGGIEQAKEKVRTYRHGAWLDEFGRDLRYSFRTFIKNPGFTVIVVLTLALGIGANTAIFSLIDALMLRRLPVRNPQELVQLKLQPADATAPSESFSYAIVRALADQREIFAGLTGFSGMSFVVGPPGSLTGVPGALVTGAYYETLGLNAAIGRLLGRGDDELGAPLVAVISDGYWERHFARSQRAIGQTVLIGGTSVTIVGVSPRGFMGANVGSTADITLPVAAISRVSPEAAPLLRPGNFWLRILARPKIGVTVSQAEARLAALWPQLSESVLAANWPSFQRKAMADSTFHLSPGGTGWTFLREMYRKPLAVLMSVVAVVLLVACANVASLLLARSSARQREIAVRLAIGAGRGRIIRQLLLESALLSLIGAACGIGIAWLSSRFLVNLISSGGLQVVLDLTPSWRVLGFTGAVSMATAVLFGVAPALQTTAAGPSAVLKEDGRMSGARSRVRSWLVSAQVALSLVLLVGAGLLVRTLQNLQDLDPGFNREGVLLVDLEARRTAFPEDLLEEVRRLPGVVSASVSTHTPLSGSIWSEPAVPAGQPIPERDNAFFVGAAPRFFATMQIPLLAGREFTDRDSASSPPVVLINEAFAQRYFSKENAVGRHLSASVRGQRRELEIVGLVKNTSARGLRAAPPPTVYVAYAQLTGDFPTTLEVRASGPIARVASDLERVLQPKMPTTPVVVRSLSAQVEATMVQERMMAALASGFGVLALALACIGLYGLLAYSVAQRIKEIGIRMALGAHRKLVMGMVLKGAARLVLIGIVLGLPAAWAASRWVESMLFGLKPTDPAATGGAVVVLTVAAMIAAFAPAHRASRVNPLTALRHE